MRIDNRTHWRSDHLKAFAVRVAQDELDPEHRRRYTVRVRYSRNSRRSSWVGGHAQYRSRAIQINVPSVTVDKVDLAFTIAHEMAHTRGVTHRQMRGSARYDTRTLDWRVRYAWALDLPLERQAPAPRPTLDARRAARLAQARQRLVAWERRLKAAQTHRRKWQARVRRYERVLAQAAKPAPAVDKS